MKRLQKERPGTPLLFLLVYALQFYINLALSRGNTFLIMRGFDMKNLRQAVINQMGGEVIFRQSFMDVLRAGADGGFNGFIYTSECVKFTKRNKHHIFKRLDEIADDMGLDRLECLSHWRSLRHYTRDEIAQGLYNADGDLTDQVYNALAWFALEEVCFDEEIREEQNPELFTLELAN